jgi:hypothetical protein
MQTDPLKVTARQMAQDDLANKVIEKSQLETQTHMYYTWLQKRRDNAKKQVSHEPKE